jgi:hypothetical protein
VPSPVTAGRSPLRQPHGALKLARRYVDQHQVHRPTVDEARLWIERLFSVFVPDLNEQQFVPIGLPQRVRRAASILLKGDPSRFYNSGYDLQSGYILSRIPRMTH